MQTVTMAIEPRVFDGEFVGLPIDCEFVRMQVAYAGTGGLA